MTQRKIWSVLVFLLVGGLCVFSSNGFAQTATPTPTPEPPHINVVKQLQTMGEICPGQEIDVTVTLYGDGTTAFIRKPVDVVCVIDKSGSMAVNHVPFNVNGEPPFPYGDTPTPGGSPTPLYTPNGAYRPFVDAVWATWKLYRYLELNPPSVGYRDYAGLVFYSTNTEPAGIPLGVPAVRTPGIELQQGSPSADPTQTKLFWWNNHLAIPTPNGSTAIGPALQRAKELIAAMPTHPEVTGTPAYPAYAGERFVVLLTDGRPNSYWSPYPSATPRWTTTAPQCYYEHPRHMARRLSLVNPWPPYTEAYNTTIFTIGLGLAVDTQLLIELADPFLPQYWPGTATPEAKHGKFYNPVNPDQLTPVFEEIAAYIANQRAGSDIFVAEIFADGTCPGGATLWTDIVPGSWNTPPAGITPGPPTRYTWEFGNLLVGESKQLSFRIMIDPYAPIDADTLIECPESQITYLNYEGYSVTEPIEDPGMHIGLCETTPLPTNTPTSTGTATMTPTCIPQQLMLENFDSGSFGVFDTHGPDNQVEVLDNSEIAHSGDHCVFFAGSDVPDGPSEASMSTGISFAVPEIRAGAVLDYYIKIKNFTAPFKSKVDQVDQTNAEGEDQFYTIINSSTATEITTYTVAFQYAYGTGWVHQQLDLSSFVGQDVVITFRSDFPFTQPNPEPTSLEPMTFLDDIRIIDYCYDGTPTPTPVPPPIPTTSRIGLIIIMASISILILVAFFRK